MFDGCSASLDAVAAIERIGGISESEPPAASLPQLDSSFWAYVSYVLPCSIYTFLAVALSQHEGHMGVYIYTYTYFIYIHISFYI